VKKTEREFTSAAIKMAKDQELANLFGLTGNISKVIG